jgi:hypothetical protein
MVTIIKSLQEVYTCKTQFCNGSLKGKTEKYAFIAFNNPENVKMKFSAV